MSDPKQEAETLDNDATVSTGKDPTGISTTQTSLVSPLHDPQKTPPAPMANLSDESDSDVSDQTVVADVAEQLAAAEVVAAATLATEAEAAKKAAARKRLGQTSIGIAPPALGSQQPPRGSPRATSPASPEGDRPTVSRPPLPLSARPQALPGPTLPTRSTAPAAPSKPPGLPSKPPATPSVADASHDAVVIAPPPKLPQIDVPSAKETTPSVAPPPLGVPGARIATPSKIGSKTLIGTAPPAAGPGRIVPRRRTPSKGMPAATPVTELAAEIAAQTKKTPAAGTVPPTDPVVAMGPPVVVADKAEAKPSTVPVIRVAQGGMLGSSSPVKTDGTLLCEILLRNGSVTQEKIDEALSLQEDRGGQIGRILVSLGACSETAIARALIDQLKLRKDGGYYFSDISSAAREKKDVVGLKVLTRPTRTVVTLLATDMFSLFLAALIATAVHWVRTYSELGTFDWTAWLVVGPGIALCMLTFLGLELYSPMAKSTPDEIRDITFAASLVHLGASVLSSLGDLPIVKWGILVRTVWWAATLFLVPVIRALVRNYFSVQPWWGIPVCVLGAAKTGRLVVRTLKAQPRSGLKPVVLLDDDRNKYGTLRASFSNEVMDVYSVNVAAAHFLTDEQRAVLTKDIFGDGDDRSAAPISSDHIPLAPEAWGAKIDVLDPMPKSARDPRRSEPKRRILEEEFFNPDSQRLTRSQITKDASQFPRGKFAEVDGVPLVGDLSLAPILAQRLKIPYAVVAMPGLDSPKLLQVIERVGGQFTHLLIIPDLFGFATMGVPAKSLGGILGVEIRQQLLLPGPRLAKRIMDTALTGAGVLFVLPFLLLIAALIKLDSKGPVFYTQKRLGKDGSYFSAYKFRTMHGDGEERLKAILDADPALRAEYDIYHKLRKDPRVTRIGRVLRKFSLDEFPQLLNVILGDMSLVGPRPYIERELTEMDGQEKIILRAPPGMTGMWQVSDRNATSFAQRVQIDVYYVRNWSPWLDIHILAKTFGVVVKGSGV